MNTTKKKNNIFLFSSNMEPKLNDSNISNILSSRNDDSILQNGKTTTSLPNNIFLNQKNNKSSSTNLVNYLNLNKFKKPSNLSKRPSKVEFSSSNHTNSSNLLPSIMDHKISFSKKN